MCVHVCMYNVFTLFTGNVYTYIIYIAHRETIVLCRLLSYMYWNAAMNMFNLAGSCGKSFPFLK